MNKIDEEQEKFSDIAYGYDELEDEKKKSWLDMIIDYLKNKNKEKKGKLEKVG